VNRRSARWLAIFGIPILVVVLLIVFWNWDWFIPVVDARASAAIGREVTMAHLHVQLGRVTKVVADDVQVAEPDGFPVRDPFVQIGHLGIQVSVVDYLFPHRVVLPLIDLDHPTVQALATLSGQNNYTLKLGGANSGSQSNRLQIGAVTIDAGRVHAKIPKLKADFNLDVATKAATGVVAEHGQQQEIAVVAHGTYAGQPVTGTLTGGGLLSLRDITQPYPMDLALANGATHVSLVGTVQDPMAFQGAALKLVFSGDNMANLYPLTGIPIPDTPRYHVAGQLAYASHRVRFQNFAGTVGNSDLGGTITEDPGQERPDVTMDLYSRHVDLADLGGFIGTHPGGATEKGATAAQRREVAHAEATTSNLLPTNPINIPKIKTADIRLKYRAEHIEGRSMPLDKLIVTMEIVNGAIDLHPLSFVIGKGQIAGNIALTPVSDNQVHAKADVHSIMWIWRDSWRPPIHSRA
jgi:AsmA family protein